MKRIILIALLILGMMPLMMVDEAVAQSGKYKNAKSLVKKIKRTQRQLAKVMARLSDAQVKRLNAAFDDNTDDSDSDGVPDIIEDASGSDDCDADSDDDGFDDGDEVENETDSHEHNQSVEVHSAIQAISESSVKVDGNVFLIVGSSELLDDDNNPAELSAFSVGQCVEAEGYYVGDVLTLDKIKLDDGCAA